MTNEGEGVEAAKKAFVGSWVEEAALSGQRVHESDVLADARAPEVAAPGAGADLSISRLEYYAADDLSSVRLGRVHMRDGAVYEIPKRLKRALLNESGELAGAFDVHGQTECVAAATGLSVDVLRPFLEVQDRIAVERLQEAVAERAEDIDEDEADDEDIDDAKIEAAEARWDRMIESNTRALDGWEQASADLSRACAERDDALDRAAQALALARDLQAALSSANREIDALEGFEGQDADD